MALTDKLTAIGSAIRDKTGSTDLLTLDEMPTAISNIEGGGVNFPDLYITGDIEYLAYTDRLKYVFDNYKIHLDSITNTINAFYQCTSALDLDFGRTRKMTGQNYTGCFSHAYNILSVKNFPVTTYKMTSNKLGSIILYTEMLKSFEFIMNDDGTPIIATWKSQTLNLSNFVGVTQIGCEDRHNLSVEVIDNTSYNLYKNEPDWFTTDIAYSRYNHDSAVATLNSLPDTSAYLAENGDKNTITFKGDSGSATDGGAINTLTEEEIAVATAKGWTVALV